jgi:hypothetical protein
MSAEHRENLTTHVHTIYCDLTNPYPVMREVSDRSYANGGLAPESVIRSRPAFDPGCVKTNCLL